MPYSTNFTNNTNNTNKLFLLLLVLLLLLLHPISPSPPYLHNNSLVPTSRHTRFPLLKNLINFNAALFLYLFLCVCLLLSPPLLSNGYFSRLRKSVHSIMALGTNDFRSDAVWLRNSSRRDTLLALFVSCAQDFVLLVPRYWSSSYYYSSITVSIEASTETNFNRKLFTA